MTSPSPSFLSMRINYFNFSIIPVAITTNYNIQAMEIPTGEDDPSTAANPDPVPVPVPTVTSEL